jgi:hypothetical protein
MGKGNMTRKTLIACATLGVVITGALFATNSTTAQTRVVSSDATAQFVPIEVGKFVVIDLPVDAKDVIVGSPNTANVILRTARQAFILGTASGQTNIVFYDAAHRLIEALDITVHNYPVPATLSPGPADVVTMYRGPGQGSDGPGRWFYLSCTHTSNPRGHAACYAREEPAGTLDSLPKGSTVVIPVGK